MYDQDAAEAAFDDEAQEQQAWLEQAPGEINLVELIDSDTLSALAERVIRERDIDKESRKEWWERAEKALALANMDRKEKSYPWPNASNIRYPLIMTAALRFNAEAYPAIVNKDMVRAEVHGRDAQGLKAARAERVAEHLSYECLHKIDGWDQETDRLLMQLPVAGTMWRKIWFDPASGKKMVRLLPPGGLIVNDDVPSLGAAPRLTEPLEMYPDDVEARIRDGRFIAGEWASVEDEDGKDSLAPIKLVEQHRRHDIDGDGYPEPYIVTVEERTQTVVRVVANWRPDGIRRVGEQVHSIEARDHYVDHHFVPAVNGKYHSIGLGVLLGDISETIDSTINMIADGAHMQSLGSGFIGREARLKGGRTRFQPGEYKQVTASGSDLRAAIVERSNGGPSPVLFQLLGLLIDAARELANVQDIQAQAGRSGQPATTTIALIEQGQMVHRAIFKRIFRSLSAEFRKLAEINAETTSPEEYAAFFDDPQVDPRADYNLADMDVTPSADPEAISPQQKLARAEMVLQLAERDMADRRVAAMRAMEAARISNVEELVPEPDPQAQAMQQIMADAQIDAAQLQNLQTSLKAAQIEAEIEKTLAEVEKVEAETEKIEAEAIETVANTERADEAQPLEQALRMVRAMKENAHARMGAFDAGRPGGMAGASGDQARLGRGGSGGERTPLGSAGRDLEIVGANGMGFGAESPEGQGIQ